MNLVEQYTQQQKWRHWDEIIEHLPLSKDQTILDLGCGTGYFLNLISPIIKNGIGIDCNKELVDYAQNQTNRNIKISLGNISNLTNIIDNNVDGMWASFVAEYFVDLLPQLKHWSSFLNPNAWIAFVEMTDLLTGHRPLPADTLKSLEKFTEYLIKNKYYDCTMGSRLESCFREAGLKDIVYHEFNDEELSFQGPASDPVLQSWSNRFDRWKQMKMFFGDDLFHKIKQDLLTCLSSQNHEGSAKVVVVCGRK
ncbi:class I SAM-dependent methyltransferase [bacterium]|nr:class I SAM-dependent methyltransferase [bacterium]MBU1916984.1 class I SAM-dependent methyltransferase [bacterium]